jgi:hypothetical protein
VNHRQRPHRSNRDGEAVGGHRGLTGRGARPHGRAPRRDQLSDCVIRPNVVTTTSIETVTQPPCSLCTCSHAASCERLALSTVVVSAHFLAPAIDPVKSGVKTRPPPQPHHRPVLRCSHRAAGSARARVVVLAAARLLALHLDPLLTDSLVWAPDQSLEEERVWRLASASTTRLGAAGARLPGVVDSGIHRPEVSQVRVWACPWGLASSAA